MDTTEFMNASPREDYDGEDGLPFHYAYREGDDIPFCQTYLKAGRYVAGSYHRLLSFKPEMNIEVRVFNFRKHKLFRQYMGMFVSITESPDLEKNEAYIYYEYY